MFIVGYDPGGNGAHGVAILKVREENARWHPLDLQVRTADSLRDAVAWVDEKCRDGRIVAVGVDSMTEWSSGASGWRSADIWLKDTYPDVTHSVVSPNSAFGSMSVNGAGFLILLAPRLRADSAMITEAHPKVCYFALAKKKHKWASERLEMEAWLLKELEVAEPAGAFGNLDHGFDAGIAVLAALRGINGDWIFDLHDLPGSNRQSRVEFGGPSHYWWPESGRLDETAHLLRSPKNAKRLLESVTDLEQGRGAERELIE
jgi:hypothetical protein